jgi:SecD/SecF fusion protein
MFSLFWGILPFSLEVDQTFIAAILTIIGYSINDTVIIFDRIREYMNLHPKRLMTQNMNDAINHTLRRTINTSMTVLFTLLILLIFGGTVIRGFVFAMSVGIIIGTYSSVFVATPLAYEAMRKKEEARLAQENATNNTTVKK